MVGRHALLLRIQLGWLWWWICWVFLARRGYLRPFWESECIQVLARMLLELAPILFLLLHFVSLGLYSSLYWGSYELETFCYLPKRILELLEKLCHLLTLGLKLLLIGATYIPFHPNPIWTFIHTHGVFGTGEKEKWHRIFESELMKIEKDAPITAPQNVVKDLILVKSMFLKVRGRRDSF